MIRLDTNIILRYLLNDNETMAAVAEELILSAEVFIANEVLAEVVYVLEGVYGLEKGKTVSVLSEMIKSNNIKMTDKYILLKALNIYASQRLDFVDSILCAYAAIDEIATFDKKLRRCIDLPERQSTA